jgi:hypothetical protein
LSAKLRRAACPACGAGALPGHRCPKKYPCCDCGRPADTFVPDPDSLVLSKEDVLRATVTDPENDRPICDPCFGVRAREQLARRMN